MKPHSYYFWKWAENDISGKPAEVHSALVRGQPHPALQAFDARPLLIRLQEAAEEGQFRDEEWEWQVYPGKAPRNAQFVFVTCPRINVSKARVRWFYNRFISLNLSGYDEQEGRLIPCLRPKLNCFISGQCYGAPEHDIVLDQLPALLRGIRPGIPEAWVELWNRYNDAVCATADGRYFRVEWREVFQERVPGRHLQWRARDGIRLARLKGRDDIKPLPARIDPDCLTYAETLKIFQIFLRGKERPPQYLWRKLY